MQEAGTDEAGPVMAKMRAMKIDDAYARHAYIRDDGLLIHDLYLFQVNSPEESHRPWDDYKLLATIPGDQAFRPLAESTCPAIKH